MKAKVIIAQATAETAETLYGLVKKMVDTTAIKAYPSVDYQAVFFSADRYDLDFVKRVLADKCFSFKIEDAELYNKISEFMTQQEFMERTGITPTAEDFDYIHAVYLNTSMNKDEFCKDFKKHGDSRIIRDVHVRVLNYEMKCERQKEVIGNLTDFLIGKAHAYDDTDFRKEAVGLVGEMEVVKRTIELGLPLWDEDRMVVLSMIEEQGK